LTGIELPVPDGRLDLNLCLRSGQVFRWRSEDDGSWVGVDGTHWYRFKASIAPELRLHVLETNANPAAASSLFRLDYDAARIEARILELGPEIGPAIVALHGIRLMRPSSLVETFFTFMCTANNNLARIIPMCWNLGSFGEPIADGLHAFPSVARIAAIDESDLRSMGFGYRGATIPKAAGEIMSRGGEDWLEDLRQAAYPELHRELCSLTGIGPKLADCIALYGYDCGEAVPLDTHIWQTFTRLYHPEWRGKAVTDFRYRESTRIFRERFRELSGWAHLFLFFGNLSSRKSG
jgi:N-glycosylase/DNA lyase